MLKRRENNRSITIDYEYLKRSLIFIPKRRIIQSGKSSSINYASLLNRVITRELQKTWARKITKIKEKGCGELCIRGTI